MIPWGQRETSWLDIEHLEGQGTEGAGDLQQRKMARSGRADTAAVLTVRMVTSVKSVHPSSVGRKARSQH